MFSITDYTYTLPENLIAQHAINPHHNAKLLVINRQSGEVEAEDTFWNITNHLRENSIFFFNNSKVLRSRVPLENIKYLKGDNSEHILKEWEIFFLKQDRDASLFEALVRPGNKFKIGTKFFLGEYVISVIDYTNSGRILKVENGDIQSIMNQYGRLPLPPYIEYDKEKEKDYQTTFAKQEGSVAAPTASLHFTEELVKKIQTPIEYITLHVWLWTFKWIDTIDVRDYQIHEETIEIEIDLFRRIEQWKQSWQEIIAVGTTVCRTLESLPYLWNYLEDSIKNQLDLSTQVYWNTLSEKIEENGWIKNITHNTSWTHLSFSSSIYIIPGHSFRIVDSLITNFHLPESSLLVLVSAFLWHSHTMKIYEHAIQQQYRFYSFWDGMYIRWNVERKS